MRCLALAQAWQDTGGVAIFFTRSDLSPVLRQRLQHEGIEIRYLVETEDSSVDADQTVVLAQELNVVNIVVDGYQFDAEYQRQIKDAGLHLLFIDDYGHAAPYSADLLLNQNIHASDTLYTN